jgi:hypothetical protein
MLCYAAHAPIDCKPKFLVTQRKVLPIRRVPRWLAGLSLISRVVTCRSGKDVRGNVGTEVSLDKRQRGDIE